MLTVSYVAVDQFFIVFPPNAGATRLSISLTPARAKTVAARAFLFPGHQSKGAPRIEVTQGGRKLRVTRRIAVLDATCYGPALLGQAVRVRMTTTPPAGGTVGVVLQWA
jgi:hypothetical protein